MGKNAQKTWARRWCQMRASGVLPAAGPAGEYTRAEWDAYAAKRELEGQTLTIEQRITLRAAETHEALKLLYLPPKHITGLRLPEVAAWVNNAALRGPTPEEIAESKKVLEDLDKREPKNGVLGTVTVE